MEIKGPIPNIPPKLPEIHLDKEEEKTSTAQPAGLASTTDAVEIHKVNAFSDAVEAAAQQNEGNTGEAHLNSEQQNLVSKFLPENEHLEDASFFLKDARSRHDDEKNSAQSKTPDSEQMAKVKESMEKAKELLSQSTTVHDGSEKDFSNDQLLSGTNLHDAVQNEIDGRHQDAAALGGQTGMDRLKNLTDPTSKGPQQNGQTYGKGMFAQEKSGGVAYAVELKDGEVVSPDKKNTDNLIGPGKALGKQLEGQVGRISRLTDDSLKSNQDVLLDGSIVTTGSDGTKVTKAKDETITVEKGDTKTVTHSDGSYEEYKNGKKTDSGGSLKSYDSENYTGNIPPQIQSLMNYFKQQAMALKPQTGAGNVDPDPNADTTGGAVDPGAAVNRAIKFSGVGTGDNLGGPTGPQSDVGSGSPSGTIGPETGVGGAIDYGQDSDKTGYTGPTHTEDPGDIKFGPQAPLEGTPDSKQTDDTSDSSASYQYWQDLYLELAARFKIMLK